MDAPGVNVVGYFNHVLGLAESARAFVRALRAAGVEHAVAAIEPVGIGMPRSSTPPVPLVADADLPHDVTVIWCNPDRYGLDIEPGELRRGALVGRWAWELAEPPVTWRAAAEPLDEIWAASNFVAGAIERGTDKPARVVPPAFAAPDAAPLDRALWGLDPDVPLFTFMFDHNSVFARKNPLAVVEAFGAAFDGGGEAALLVKSLNSGFDRAGDTALLKAARSRPGVRVFAGVLSAEYRNALLAGSDCYVSLHRSEGFGLTIAEAMSFGTPVIATAYSGNLDFTDDEDAYLVRAPVVAVGPSGVVYPPTARWAEPDVAHAATLMRAVVDAPAEARARGDRGRERIRAALAPEAVGTVVRAELERLAA